MGDSAEVPLPSAVPAAPAVAAPASEDAHFKAPEDNPPNPTLYIRNISEKVGKDELRKSLWQMFHQYGEIVDIFCRPKALACKGQAWVCFKETPSADKARQQMQGYSFYSKSLSISFARAKSDVISKEDGTFTARKSKAKKKKRFGQTGDDAAAPSAKRAKVPAAAGDANKILFVENCPEERPDVAALLQTAFTNFPGFREVRVVPGNRGVAFVEFADEITSTQALAGLQDHNLAGRSIRLSYAKRG